MIDGKDELITKFVIMFCSVPYHFRLYLGGQKGRARTLSLVIKTLARTGTILSSYLRNRNVMNTTLNSITSEVEATTTEVGMMTNLAGTMGNRE